MYFNNKNTPAVLNGQLPTTSVTNYNPTDYHDIVSAYSNGGTLGLILLFLIISASVLDIKGLLKDIRTGFLAVQILADKITFLVADLEKNNEDYKERHEEIIQKLDKINDKINK